MNRAIDDVERCVAASHDVANFLQSGSGKLAGRAGEAVDAADFLHGSGRNGEQLAADSKQNDLLGARLRVDFRWRREVHQRTPDRSGASDGR